MTTTNMKTENSILESRELRNELLERTEVLNKVKELFLLPKLQMMTVQQVADYYEVNPKTINECYRRFNDELSHDGVTKYTPKTQFPNDLEINKTHYYTEVKLSENVSIRIPNTGMILFPVRAILRIGMLLRDSEIAKEVRTQLLNTFEKATPEQQVEDLESEQEIAIGFLDALTENNQEQILLSFQKYAQFKNRHIAALQQENEEIKTDNQMLTGEILKWNDRSQVNRIVRYLSHALNVKWQYIWTDLYNELQYKHGINLKTRKTKRKNDSMLSTVKESEWPAVQQSLAALCEKFGFSPEKVYQKALKFQA